MTYSQNIEDKLGFGQIREMIGQFCVGSLGRKYAADLAVAPNQRVVRRRLDEWAEFGRLMSSHTDFPDKNYEDISEMLDFATLEGSFLTQEQFFELLLTLQTLNPAVLFFRKPEHQAAYPTLWALSRDVQAASSLTELLTFSFDERGLLRDRASAKLQDIRRQILGQQAGIRSRTDQLLREARVQGIVAEDASLTIRNGRMVIPVPAEFKRRLKGFIHDESASGQTVFIEPTEIFESNNRLRELENEEKREIIRILRQLTGVLRPQIPELHKGCDFLGKLDIIRAKARLAARLGGICPGDAAACRIKLVAARHPLLQLSLEKQGRKAVPLSLEIDEQNRILVISGPNAGGKSVCLKTVGLLQYMYQCGLPISADEGSQMGFFDDIFLDIGDQQSLENDLSTYSSHLINLKQILARAGAKSLVLIDEFGSGTDPDYGGAIARAVLEGLNQARVRALVTTHYESLKSMSAQNEGVFNGAMRFDMHSLSPLYSLETGKPGSSFAIEIAQKTSLPKHILDKAENYVGHTKVSYDKLLASLETEKQALQQKILQTQSRQKHLDKLTQDYQQLKTQLEDSRKTQLNTAKAQARQLILEAKQQIEIGLKTLKEPTPEPAKIKVSKENLQNFAVQNLVAEPLSEAGIAAQTAIIQQEDEYLPAAGSISHGDFVRLKDSPTTLATVLSIRNKDAEIAIGELKSWVKFDRLEKISRKTFKKAEAKPAMYASLSSLELNKRMADFSVSLDLRGLRSEELLGVLDEFLDNAMLLGQNQLRIIHGRGDGVLKEMVRGRLKNMKQVKSFGHETYEQGGDGVTVVVMK